MGPAAAKNNCLMRAAHLWYNDLMPIQQDPAARLTDLRTRHRGMRRTEALRRLRTAISGALFLDEDRRKAWLKAAEKLDATEAEELTGAIIRENFRWKKGIRKISFDGE